MQHNGPAGAVPSRTQAVTGHRRVLDADGPVVQHLAGNAGHVQRQAGDGTRRSQLARQVNGLQPRVVVERRQREIPGVRASAHRHLLRRHRARERHRPREIGHDTVKGILGGDGDWERLVDELRRRNGVPHEVIHAARKSVVVDDRAHALAVGDRPIDRAGEIHIEDFVQLDDRIADDRDVDGLACHAGREDQRAGGRHEITHHGRAASGGEVDPRFLHTGRGECDVEDRLSGSDIPLHHAGGVTDANVRFHHDVHPAYFQVGAQRTADGIDLAIDRVGAGHGKGAERHDIKTVLAEAAGGGRAERRTGQSDRRIGNRRDAVCAIDDAGDRAGGEQLHVQRECLA